LLFNFLSVDQEVINIIVELQDVITNLYRNVGNVRKILDSLGSDVNPQTQTIRKRRVVYKNKIALSMVVILVSRPCL
jgi:hypothetical protein